MSTKRALSAVAVAVGIAVCAAPSAAAAKGHRHAPVVEELASFAAPGCVAGLRLGQHARARRGALRDRRQGRPRAAHRSAQRRDHDVRHRPAAVDPAQASGERSTSPSPAVTPTSWPPWQGPDQCTGIYRIGRDGTGSHDRRHRQVVRRPSTGDPPSPSRAASSTRSSRIQGVFAVTDGHLNRVLRVGRDGSVSEIVAFDNVAPTGLAALGPALFIGQAGPVPPSARRRQGPRAHALVLRRAPGGLRRPADRRRRARARAWPLRPLPGHLGSPERAGERREAGLPEHRHPRPGRPSTAPSRRSPEVWIARPRWRSPATPQYVVTLTGNVLKINNITPRHRRRLH